MHYKFTNAELSFVFRILLEQLNHSYKQEEFISSYEETTLQLSAYHLCKHAENKHCHWFTRDTCSYILCLDKTLL